jgi:hypothetical protein
MPTWTRPRLVGKPTVTLRIPRAADIIVVPVVRCGERNDRDAERRYAEIRQRPHFTAIVE